MIDMTHYLTPLEYNLIVECLRYNFKTLLEFESIRKCDDPRLPYNWVEKVGPTDFPSPTLTNYSTH